MKKLFSLLTLALLTMSAWAATDVTVDFSAQGYTNAQDFDGQTVTINGITLSFSKGEGQTTPKYYTSGTAIRLYTSNTMTVTAPTNKVITNIAFTYSDGAWDSTSPNVGAYANGAWTGSDETIVFTNNKSNQVRIKSMVVTLDEPSTTPMDPVFNPTTGYHFSDSLEVTITSSTGADIVYVVNNGTQVTAASPATVTIYDNATITAYAVLNGVESENIVEATYTKLTGTNVTVDFSAQGYENSQDFDGQTVTINGISIAFSKGTGSTTPKYYTSDTSLRLYANNTMTVTAPTGKVITNIVFTYASGAFNAESPSVGTYADGAWTGNASSIVFTNTSNGQVRIISMIVTLEDASTPPVGTVEAPVFDPASGTKFAGSLTVTMTSATEGADIVYVLNDNDAVTAPSPATVTITADADFLAYAVKDGVESEYVEATYTRKTDVESLEIAADLADDTEFRFTGNAVVTYQYGQYLYIKDDTDYGLIYGSTNGGQNPVFAQGTELAPNWEAKVDIYNGLHEFVSVTGLDSIGITTVAPEMITADQMEDKVNAYVQIDHVKSVTGTTATLIDGTTVALYKRFGISIPEFDNADAIITGIVSVYNGTYQINFISVEGIVAAPVISPASCNFDESIEVTITAEEGATIKYSTDEQTWNTYSEPLTFNATTTVYAKAVVGTKESVVVSATYTKVEPVTYTLVTDVAQLADGDKIIFVGYHMLADSVTVKPYAMANFKTTNFAAGAVEQVDNTSTTVKANVFTLNANEGNWNFRQDADGRYLYAAGTTDSQNYLKLDTVAHDATITITDEVPVIEFVGENATRFMRFNDNNEENILFSCYKKTSSVKNPVYIFKATVATAYERGDVNMDGEIDVNDVTRLIDVVLGKNVEYDETAADCNIAGGDGGIDINDVTALINRVLTGNW